MKICIFGAGAVGGYLAAMLTVRGEHEVSVVARGDHLEAMSSRGLTLITPRSRLELRPHAVAGSARELPEQDVVFVTLKAHAQSAAAGDIASLLGTRGVAVFVNNGIPWWWRYRGAAAGAGPLPLLDPEGALWGSVGAPRAIGCVAYSANAIESPGVVRHIANNQWLLGEPDDSRSERLLAVTRLMCDAGLHAEVAPNIRHSIWRKLLRNAPLSSVCALTRLSVDALAREPELPALCNAVIDELAAIALADGCDLADHVEAARSAIRLGGAIDGSAAGGLRPSMLQDVDCGRRMEVQAILGQVRVFARESGTPCPTLDVLLPLLRGLDIAIR